MAFGKPNLEKDAEAGKLTPERSKIGRYIVDIGKAVLGFKTTQFVTVGRVAHILVTSQLFTCQRAWRRPQDYKLL